MVIFGSAALMAAFPELSEGPFETTKDADFVLTPIDADLALMLRETLGEQSDFGGFYGYYADCVRAEMVETFPAGWEARLVPLAGYDDVFFLDPYDVALVKLVVGREKDLALVRALIDLGQLDPARLRQRYAGTPLEEPDLFRAGRNLHAVCPSAR